VAQTHEDFAELTGLYVLGALSEAERKAFEAHASSCATCAAEIRALTPVSSVLAHLAPSETPSPEVRQRIMASIRQQGSVKLERAASAERFHDRPAPRRGSVVAWLAVAASLALAVILGGYALQLRRDAGVDRLASAVLAAPDLVRIDLAGQQVAPSASARAFWSRSQGLVFTASNLPAAPAGRGYQLWVLSSQPAPMSAGMLTSDANGRLSMTIKTPVDMPQPVAMAVTLEPEGGVSAPTGEKYLVGLAN
jgi:anti-sigma-K factor RskA